MYYNIVLSGFLDFIMIIYMVLFHVEMFDKLSIKLEYIVIRSSKYCIIYHSNQNIIQIIYL